MFRSWLFIFVITLCVVSPVIAGFDRSAYDEPRSGFSVSDRVEVVDTAVFSSGFYSVDGSSWSQFSLQGELFGSWVLGEAQSDVVPVDARYFAVFSCSWSGSWDCSDTWQVLDRGADEDSSGSSEYVPKDSLQGDFEALQALYASTQGDTLPALSSSSDLPEPRDAEYPYTFIINDEIWALSRERRRGIGEWVNHGAIWKDRTGWESMTPQTMGEAVGVEVDADGRVVILDMQKVTTAPYDDGYLTTGNGLAGVLPQEIGNLKQLAVLNLKQNFFHGEIPDVFEGFTELERFSLSGMTWEMNLERRINWHESDHRRVSYDDNPFSHSTRGKKIMNTNNFRSQLPSSLDGLPKLELIEATHQYLLGPLPEWSNMPSIKAIFIGSIRGPPDHKMGEIPASWGNLTTMQVFGVGNYHTHPRFSGELPAGMNHWNNLANFQIGSNEFSGDLPLGNQDDLVYFTVGRNKFSGEFPWDSIFNGKNARLSKFGLAYNDFIGELPQTVPPALLPTPQREEKYRLDDISIHGNSFSGPLPDWIPELSNLQIINVAGNSFTGPFPEALLERDNLKTVYLHNNEFSGPLPDREWSTNRIRWFYISGNNFEGEIPDSWQTLFQNDDGTWVEATFQRYLFHENEFSGRVPDWAKNVNWGNFQQNTFSNNRFTFQGIIDAYESVTPVLGDNFRVAPQKPFGSAQEFHLSVGDSLVIDFSDSVTHADNVYSWERDGEQVASQSTAVLQVSSVSSSDAGVYRLVVENPNVPELVLSSVEVEVRVS